MQEKEGGQEGRCARACEEEEEAGACGRGSKEEGSVAVWCGGRGVYVCVVCVCVCVCSFQVWASGR